MVQKRKKSKYVSKGIVGNAMKTPANGAEKIMNKLAAWKAGKNVKLQVHREYNEETGKMIGSGGPPVSAAGEWGSYTRKPKREETE